MQFWSRVRNFMSIYSGNDRHASIKNKKCVEYILMPLKLFKSVEHYAKTMTVPYTQRGIVAVGERL